MSDSPSEQLKIKHSVKTKLLLIVLSGFLAVGLLTVALTNWMYVGASEEQVADLERQMRSSLHSRAKTLVNSHAQALRGLAADNALTDIQELIQQGVSDDEDVTYGAFVTSEGKVLAYTSPTNGKSSNLVELDRLEKDLSVKLEIAEEGAPPPPMVATVREADVFGMPIYEVAYPVVDEGTNLGTVRYGVTLQNLNLALNNVRSQSQASLQRMLLMIALGAGLLVTAVTLLVLRSAHRMTHPLTHLTEAARKVARGDMSVRVDVHTEDELELLAATFNQMLDANEEAFSALEEKTRQALEAVRVKSEFLANMSHEIRTPLNGITGMTQLLRKADNYTDRQLRFLNTIEVSSEALLSIVNDVLDFSKLEAGRVQLQHVEFSPHMLISEVVEMMSPRANEKGVEIIAAVAPAVPETLIADPDRIRQVVTNLVGNATKFTMQGEIVVSADIEVKEGRHARLLVSVKDTGIGIGPEHGDKLFESFSQADGSLTREHGGTGLGLAICKKLVECMGGAIAYESELGVGSRFYFDISVDVATQKERTITHTTSKTVLVAEGSQTTRDILKQHLLYWGYECIDVASAAKAMEVARDAEGAKKIDAAILSADIALSDGGKLLSTLNARKGPRKTRIILTARATEVPSVPSDAVLTKPLRTSEVYNALQQLLAEGKVASSTSKPPVHTVSTSPKSLKILLVEDNEINQIVATEMLQDMGIDVEVASNGLEGFKAATTKHYDAVLMDCQMPVMDGYEATRRIREAGGETSDVPIFALTAHALPGDRAKVLKAGMDEYLTKPLAEKTLSRLLDRELLGKDASARKLARAARRQEVMGGSANGGSQPAPPPSEKPEASFEPVQPEIPALDPEVKRSERAIQMFLQLMPEQTKAISDAFEAQDRQDFRNCAHRCKGGCSSVGASKLAATCLELQRLGEEKQLDSKRIRATLDQLEAEYKEVKRLLERELGESKPVAERRA